MYICYIRSNRSKLLYFLQDMCIIEVFLFFSNDLLVCGTDISFNGFPFSNSFNKCFRVSAFEQLLIWVVSVIPFDTYF